RRHRCAGAAAGDVGRDARRAGKRAAALGVGRCQDSGRRALTAGVEPAGVRDETRGVCAMSRTRKAAITAVFSYAQFAMAIIPGLVLVPLTLRCLGARPYGLWLTIGEVLAYALMADPGILHILPWMVAEADGSAD